MSLDKIIREETRLIILRELAEQPNESATSSALQGLLAEMFMIVREREWVERELGWLKEMDAVRLTPAGSVQIATLQPAGKDHLAHRRFIAGVKRTTLPVT
ncbi:MAG: hypothetical protein EOQ55_27195 [Mesorhizobium sp.]|uniref:VpaChn25_0724 family phage protein n=1 Tax=Mesorhizobium sp. TaxID=1871066 RepID=UPI000FE9B07A|nr:hypothetical protein [Mesorhizobium sp.]RWG12241.1 MAG: hypothetical protein EOQ55_27195 [Mesorhizobium sp.]